MKKHLTLAAKQSALLSLASFIAVGLLPLCSAFAAPGDLDLSFDAGSGVDGEVHSIVLQPDGRILIGGSFSTVKGLVRRGIARLNADGSGDTSFNPAIDNLDYYSSVQSIVLQPDGKVLIGGGFTTVNGVGRTNIARLHPDGTLDTSFNAAAVGEIEVVALQSDGKVVIGGSFTTVSSVGRTNMARLNSDGSLDTSFNAGNVFGFSSPDCIAVQPDGKVLFGGYMLIGRLNTNGTRDITFNASAGEVVNFIVLQPDGKVLIGAGYVNGVYPHGIARLNANGTLDSTFADLPTIGGPQAIALQSDGKVVIAGSIYKIDGVPRSGFARLNPDGTLDADFDPSAIYDSPFASPSVSAVAVQPDGRVLIGGGHFATVDGLSRYGIARLNPDGSLDASFNAGSGIDSPVLALAAQADGKVLIGGRFLGVQGMIRSRFARLNADGTVERNFDSQLFPVPSSAHDPINSQVTAITVQPNGKILVGSESYNYDFQFGGDRSSFSVDLVRLNADGTVDSSFNAVHGSLGLSLLESVCIGLQPDGKVLFGGSFDSLNGIGVNRIARLNADGDLDLSFNADVEYDPLPLQGLVRAIAVQPDGKVLIVGLFTTVNGVGRTNIARLNYDGSLDTSFDPGAASNGFVNCVALQPDGKVLISPLKRLNADGTLDATFKPELFGVSSILVQPDAKIIIGGELVNGISQQNIARLNPDGSLDASFNSRNLDGPVETIAVQADGRLLIGGGFGSVDGFARNYVARLLGDPPVLKFEKLNNQLVLSWTNAGFTLQSAPAVTGTFTNIPGATSPYTNSFTGPQRFFRLFGN